MTYNFDPDRWYDNELLALRAKVAQGQMTRRAYDRAVEALDRKLEEMWRRLDGAYQIPQAAGRRSPEELNMEVRPYEPADEAAVVRLWIDCGLIVPWNDPRRDIRRKQAVQPDKFLVGCLKGEVVATVMAGYDGHRGWINYLAVHPAHRRIGIGRRMMDEAETRLRAAGCPKINLQVRGANSDVLAFYRKLGFKVDEVVSLGKRLEADE